MISPRSDCTNSKSCKALLWVGIALGYFCVALTINLFHTLHADELLLSYTASEVARGQLPGLDFLTQEPFAFFAPFALAYKLISHSIEAERLVLAAMMASATTAMAAVVWRHRGKWAGIAAFLLLALNVPYVANFTVLNAQGPSYFGLCGAFAAVMLPRRPNWRHYAVAGLFVGFALSSRLVVSLASLTLAAHAVLASGGETWSARRAIGRLAAAAVAAVIVALPDALIVLQNPTQMVYIRAGVSADMARHVMGETRANSFLAGFSTSHLRAYFNYFMIDAYHSRFQNTLAPLAALTALIYVLAARVSKALPPLTPLGRDVAWAAAFALPLVVGYGLTWMQDGDYYNVVYPFLVVIMVGVVDTLLTRLRDAGPQWQRPRKMLAGMAATLLVLHSAQGVAHGVWQLSLRNLASLGQPQTINRAACWLEGATSPQDQVLTGSPIIAMVAGRLLPAGFEPASTIKHWWGDLPLERQAGLPMLRPKDVRALVADGTPAIIIGSDELTPIIERFIPDLPTVLHQRYVLVGTMGGKLFPLTVYAERDWLARRTTPLPPLPTEEDTLLRAEMLRSGRYAAAATALAHDLGRSAARFPRDVRGALARLAGASWSARCGDYFGDVIDHTR